MIRLRAICCALAGFGLLTQAARPAEAQSSILAHAIVLTPAITGAGVRPVDFGTISPGTPTTRAITTAADSTATGVALMSFSGVSGNRGAQLVFTWADLTHATSGMTIPFSLNGSYGMYCFDRKTTAAVCTLFNPGSSGGTTGTIVATPPAPPGGNTGTLRVYLGGALNPPASLGPGLYTATISVTLTRI